MGASENPIPAIAAENRYTEDPALQALLRRHLSPTALAAAEQWLVDMGELSAGTINRLSFDADAHPPVLERYDARGERADRLVYHPSHDELERLSFGRGIVGNFYKATHRAALGPHVWQAKFAMCYLFAQAEQGLYCPIAMTDAAANMIELHADPALRERYLPLLTSTDPGAWAQGAMFLTEREGGSDVGANTTTARCVDTEGRAEVPGEVRAEGPAEWRITGEKWFCSNAGAEVMMVLARAGGEGTRGLGLFLVPFTGNNVRIKRLKNKLGTRSIPTGEVSFRDAIGFPVGPVEHGFRTMTAMLNVCRMHNAVASLALTRRVLWEAASYLHERRAFGRTADSYGLVQDLLCQLFAELEAGLEALMVVAREPNHLLLPLLKLNTARLAVRAASEAIELLGGNGYIEESVTARFFRDAQVLPVWEGTTNILYLDALRWIVKEQAHRSLIGSATQPAAPDGLAARSAGSMTLAALSAEFDQLSRLPPYAQPVECKRLCDKLWPAYLASRLANGDARLAAIAARLRGERAMPLAKEYECIVRSAIG